MCNYQIISPSFTQVCCSDFTGQFPHFGKSSSGEFDEKYTPHSHLRYEVSQISLEQCLGSFNVSLEEKGNKSPGFDQRKLTHPNENFRAH